MRARAFPTRGRVFATVQTLAGRLELEPLRMTLDDLWGAIACFLLSVGCALPGVVPFLLIERPLVALRVSNAVLLGSLFVVGTMWGKRIGARRLTTGLVLVLLGTAMVEVAVALGV